MAGARGQRYFETWIEGRPEISVGSTTAECRATSLAGDDQMTADEDWKDAPCWGCHGYTNHKVLYSVEVEEGTYSLIQCKGCDRVSMEHFAEWPDAAEVNYYPSSALRAPPQWMASPALSAEQPALMELHREIYHALGGGQYRLAFMGIRAFFEQMMILRVGDHGSFLKNIDAFCKQGLMSLVERDAMNDI